MTVPHPIPYQGSKRNIAPDILGYFPPKVHALHEPFAGSAAVSLAAAARGLAEQYWLNDLNKPLMDLWATISTLPTRSPNSMRRSGRINCPIPAPFTMRSETSSMQPPDRTVFCISSYGV
ncbi:MAG: hypothetical protein GW893_02625 [Armatimonadetes bacterium]|nr:hypothetical protein [Armatimonadota bacterium]PIU62644.1 MAG: hypothetical protein COS85_17990 [Armatimonadetes bacterium CG07_land_8_20_14_0_80_59_28]PIX42769.1 MAG: hypothetical protein COZ56_08575 [Armatimonadetes bacterium CG_4_8_14_3_um_filter_58_9]PJB69226.1 MAG: hypothetical protein CO095_10210 [Armatimonadetes bacterium CG_4_9_14_3_um_filter_58_7]